GRTMSYDEANRLKSVAIGDSIVLENMYDAFGNRVRKVEGSRQTFYLYHGNNVVYELESDIANGANPKETWHVFVGNTRAAQVVDGAVQYVVTDHLGSTRVI